MLVRKTLKKIDTWERQNYTLIMKCKDKHKHTNKTYVRE